jgi:hypothetical protein
VLEPLPGRPGRPERRDHEYERRGMAHVLMAFEPLAGRREVEVTEQRRGKEFAEMVGRLAEEVYYSEAERIRADTSGVGQPLHPHGRRLLRDLSPGARPPAGAAHRVRVQHAGARRCTARG